MGELEEPEGLLAGTLDDHLALAAKLVDQLHACPENVGVVRAAHAAVGTDDQDEMASRLLRGATKEDVVGIRGG